MLKKEKLPRYVSLGELVKNKKLNKYNLSKSTLHYWSKMGLIRPAQTVGKTKIYNLSEILLRIKKIREYQAINMSLEEIEKILDNIINN